MAVWSLADVVAIHVCYWPVWCPGVGSQVLGPSVGSCLLVHLCGDSRCWARLLLVLQHLCWGVLEQCCLFLIVTVLYGGLVPGGAAVLMTQKVQAVLQRPKHHKVGMWASLAL